MHLKELSTSHHVPASYTFLTTPQLEDISARDLFKTQWDNFLLAAHSSWCVHICTQMLLMCPEWISSRHECKFQLSQAAKLLEFVAIEVLGTLPSATTGNKYVIIIPQRFSKLTQAFPTVRINWMQIATIILNSWVMAHGIPVLVCTDNVSQFVSKLLTACLPFPWGEEAHKTSLLPADYGASWKL